MASGVRDKSPFMAYRISAWERISGISSRASSICWSKSSGVKGSSVGESSDSPKEGMSSG